MERLIARLSIKGRIKGSRFSLHNQHFQGRLLFMFAVNLRSRHSVKVQGRE